MLIDTLMEDIKTAAKAYNEENGMLTEGMDIIQNDDINFETPVIESFIPEVFEAITEEEILNEELSESTMNNISTLALAYSELYKIL